MCTMYTLVEFVLIIAFYKNKIVFSLHGCSFDFNYHQVVRQIMCRLIKDWIDFNLLASKMMCHGPSGVKVHLCASRT